MEYQKEIANRAKRLIGRLLTPGRRRSPDANDYQLLENGHAPEENGWQVRSAAEGQHQAFESLLKDVRAGNPRIDFVAAAKAIEFTGLADPLLIEIGCGSGYYCEALPILLRHPLRYIGVDFSLAMLSVAQMTYGSVPFLAGDACRLPLPDASCDILISGTSLMHIPNYRQAIAESVRVSRKWCIFHTVPLVLNRTTTLLRKLAYGQRVVEVIFNQADLETMLAEQKLVVRAIFESIPYDVSAVLGEPSWTSTYLCQKT